MLENFTSSSIEEPLLLQPETPGNPHGHRDAVFYLQTVVFKVEDTLFRVPIAGLNVKGTPFPEIFRAAKEYINDAGEVVKQGTRDEYPFMLEKTAKDSFRGFLRSIYRFIETPLTYEELVGGLYLATKWNFSELRERIMNELYDFMPGRSVRDRIIVAAICKVEQWLADALASLVLEPLPLDLTNLVDLKFEGFNSTTMARLTLVREQRQLQAEIEGRHPGQFCQCNLCATDFAVVRRQTVVQQVRRTFASELAAASI